MLSTFRSLLLALVFELSVFSRSVTYADSILELPPKENFAGAEHSMLSKKQRWSVIVHGLRGGILDPAIWSMRRIDRTDNRRLVPIRPFYLRASEQEAFRLIEIQAEFSFSPASVEEMELRPELHSPIFEIRFHEDFRMGLPGEPPPVDRSYAVRLSATPLFPSAILYRSHANTVLLDAAKERLEPERRYFLRLTVQPKAVNVWLDEQQYFEHVVTEETDLQKGLVSLIGNWHPLVLHRLEVRGTEGVKGDEVPYRASGLVHLTNNVKP